jgi:hypothetical protein
VSVMPILLRIQFCQFTMWSFSSWKFQELAHDRKILELKGVIHKDVYVQTDSQEEIIGERPPRTSHCAPQITKLAPLASTPAQPNKVPAFQMLSQSKTSESLGLPKWKRQMMAKARAWAADAIDRQWDHDLNKIELRPVSWLSK